MTIFKPVILMPVNSFVSLQFSYQSDHPIQGKFVYRWPPVPLEVLFEAERPV